MITSINVLPAVFTVLVIALAAVAGAWIADLGFSGIIKRARRIKAEQREVKQLLDSARVAEASRHTLHRGSSILTKLSALALLAWFTSCEPVPAEEAQIRTSVRVEVHSDCSLWRDIVEMPRGYVRLLGEQEAGFVWVIVLLLVVGWIVSLIAADINGGNRAIEEMQEREIAKLKEEEAQRS